MAQIARVILLANAMATSILGFFISILDSRVLEYRLALQPIQARHGTHDQQPPDIGLPGLPYAPKSFLSSGGMLL